MSLFRLADELFLIAHDEYSGRALVHDDLLDTGLAGAVLAELLLDGRISCSGGRVSAVGTAPGADPVCDAALAELRARGSHPTRAWVEYLRPGPRMMVAQRLIDAGLVLREQSRGMLGLRRRVRYPGTDATTCTLPRVRLAYVLERQRPVKSYLATLAALVLVTGLDHQLAVSLSRHQARARLRRLTTNLSAELRALVAGVDTAVAAIALAVRR